MHRGGPAGFACPRGGAQYVASKGGLPVWAAGSGYGACALPNDTRPAAQVGKWPAGGQPVGPGHILHPAHLLHVIGAAKSVDGGFRYHKFMGKAESGHFGKG